MTRRDGALVKGVYKKGCLGGLVTVEEEDGSLQVGAFRDGQLLPGPLWSLSPGDQGATYTRTQGGYTALTRALLTGEQVVFLYPDLSTALQGNFVAGTMLSAREALVDSHRILPDGMMSVSVALSPSPEQYTTDPSTDLHLSSQPLLRDPYEAKVGRHPGIIGECYHCVVRW